MSDPKNPNYWAWPDYDEPRYSECEPDYDDWDDDEWWEEEYESDPEDDPFYYSDY